MAFEDAERARRFLDRLDFERYMDLEWEIETWSRNGLELNLALSRERSTLKIFEPVQNADPVMQLLKDYEGHPHTPICFASPFWVRFEFMIMIDPEELIVRPCTRYGQRTRANLVS